MANGRAASPSSFSSEWSQRLMCYTWTSCLSKTLCSLILKVVHLCTHGCVPGVCVCVFGASLPSSEMEQTDKVVMEQWVYGDEMMRGNEVSRALWQCRILSRLSSHVISFHGHKVRTSPYHRVRRVSLLFFFFFFFFVIIERIEGRAAVYLCVCVWVYHRCLTLAWWWWQSRR